MNSKRGETLNKVVVEIILIALVFALFFMANAEKIKARGVKQQILEKQTALLIDSAVPGMSFEISKTNKNGYVGSVELKGGKVFITVNGLGPYKGYPYFTPYEVFVEEESSKFVVYIR